MIDGSTLFSFAESKASLVSFKVLLVLSNFSDFLSASAFNASVSFLRASISSPKSSALS